MLAKIQRIAFPCQSQFAYLSKFKVKLSLLSSTHVPTHTYNSMIQDLAFTPSQQRDFIKTCLGPALKASVATRNLKLMMLDDQRAYLPDWVKTVLSDPDAAKYISGIGLHWCVYTC